VWFGIPDGLSYLGPIGYGMFVERHHNRELPTVYAKMHAEAEKIVEDQMHEKLLSTLSE
jgi:hypothetical protein